VSERLVYEVVLGQTFGSSALAKGAQADLSTAFLGSLQDRLAHLGVQVGKVVGDPQRMATSGNVAGVKDDVASVACHVPFFDSR
jgi:hypothetical protein